ncbi:MAG: CHASE3 domain-containing protein, partial [Geminicoccaceae bacterium]
MRTAARPLLVVSILIALLVALAAGLTWQFSRELDASRAAGRRTVQTIDAARMLLSRVQDAETGQRGFIITRRASYLQPYRLAVAAIPAQAEALAGLVADSPGQAARARRLRSLLDTVLAELRRTVELAERGDGAGAVAVIQGDRGKIAMDQIRELIGEMIAAENALLAGRIAQSDRSQRGALYAAILGSALALTALLVGAALLLRSNRRLRRTESQLARQRMLLQSTLDSCRNGIAAFDAKGALAAHNRGFFELLGLPASTAEAGTSFAALRELERERASQALADPGQEAGDGHVEAVVGQRNLEICRDAMPDGGFVLSVLDITRRTQAEAVIRQAQKMEAVGRLTGGIAHDFNNTLQVIASNLDLLARALPEGSDSGRRARNAALGVERGARLTAQLLAFARLQPLDPQVVNLGQVVRETTELLRRSLGEQVEIETVVAGGLWNTLADRTQIENAILNLAINARDAMAD